MMTSWNEKKNPRNWPFVQWNHRSPVNSSHKGQWRGALMLSLICAWIYGWVNNRKAGDLRRHRAHYDVDVMRSTYTYFMGYNLHLCGLMHRCNIGHTPETYLKLKYREISFVHNLLLSCQLVFQILYRARQCHCRALYKISKWVDNRNGCYGRMKFREIWV